MKASGDVNASFNSQHTNLTGDSTTTDTSSASSRYGLDEEDNSPVLVYEYRGDVEIIPQKELAERVNRGKCNRMCSWYQEYDADHYNADPSKRVTRKSIPRGTSSLDLYGSDLCLPQEKDELKHKAAFWVNLASVPVPRAAYWRRLLTGACNELYIVSPESSPENSQYEGDSRKCSPTNTWQYGSQHADAQPGAQT